jgi:hypothetical protein
VRIDFHVSPEPPLGVVWELALVDRRTRDLRNDATHLFARAKPRLADPGKLHKELLRNTVEIVSGICRTVGEAMDDVRGTLEAVIPVTTSTVLRSSSLCSWGCSPRDSRTRSNSWLAVLDRSRVDLSTRANSHSTPSVGPADAAYSMVTVHRITGAGPSAARMSR